MSASLSFNPDLKHAWQQVLPDNFQLPSKPKVCACDFNSRIPRESNPAFASPISVLLDQYRPQFSLQNFSHIHHPTGFRLAEHQDFGGVASHGVEHFWSPTIKYFLTKRWWKRLFREKIYFSAPPYSIPLLHACI
jgi:hypothetical protein